MCILTSSTCILLDILFANPAPLKPPASSPCPPSSLRHGGRCLCPGDTRSVSALRAALVDAGLEMRPDEPSQNSSPAANRAENGQQRALNENNDRDDDNDVGGDGSSCVRAATCSEMSGKPSKPIAGRADGTHLWNVPQHVPTSASSRARRPRHHQQQQRPRHLLQRCFVVSAHGKWTVPPPPPPPLPPPPLPQRALLSSPCSESERKKGGANERNNNTDEDSNGQHNQIVGGDDDVDEGADGGVTNPRSYRRRRPCPLRSAAHDELWKLLKIQARAKVVSLLWLEACRRVAEVRPPESCECVFRPGPWPIRRFDEEHKRHDFKVAVTGFAGGERTGWEELITVGMGAVLSKSLKKRFTTHLVCKEVRVDMVRREPWRQVTCVFLSVKMGKFNVGGSHHHRRRRVPLRSCPRCTCDVLFSHGVKLSLND